MALIPDGEEDLPALLALSCEIGDRIYKYAVDEFSSLQPLYIGIKADPKFIPTVCYINRQIFDEAV
jgi:hypothetical protein